MSLTSLEEAVKRHHFEVVMELQDIEDELRELVEKRDLTGKLIESLEILYPGLGEGE